MLETLRALREHFLANGLVPTLFSIAGFTLALFLVARLMSEKRAPANTFAWLLIIVLVPWVGVPLYLLLGGRKLRRLAERALVVAHRAGEQTHRGVDDGERRGLSAAQHEIAE